MEIVTGDRYLDMLARFVEKNVAALLDGSTVLKLNPLGLHYLQARLDSLLELERLRIAAPVDYLRAYIADLGDHRALELLRRVLRLLETVKVVSVLQSPARDPTPINLLPFEHLRSLELRGCDLSTSAARGLLQLRPHLEKLICHNSTVMIGNTRQDALRHIFAERMVDVRSSEVWSRLESVSCACNGIPVMDESLQLLPEVETLDLRRNKLTYVCNLEKCNRLKFLDLGFNWIQSVSRLEQVASSLTVLVLRFNALTTTRGIESLYSLRSLDLSHNLISNFPDLEKFESLRFLVSLNLESNPVSFAPDYRERMFSVFVEPAKLCLDGRYMTTIENWKVKKLIIKRSKKDGGFGLYIPAVKASQNEIPKEDEEAAEECIRSKKKAGPRLAVISDDHLKLQPTTTLSDQQQARAQAAAEATSFSNISGGVDSRVKDLMERVESLKKEKSKLYLAEVSSLFDKDVENTRGESTPSSGGDRRFHQKSRSGRKLSRKRVSWGIPDVMSSSLAEEPPEKRSVLQMNPMDIISSNPVLNQLIDKNASLSSPRSPPQFNMQVLQRRQHLEEELLQTAVEVESNSSDSSTISSDAEELESLRDTLNSLDVRKAEPESSRGLLVEAESCFSNPMWIGSASDGGKIVDVNNNNKSDEVKLGMDALQSSPQMKNPRHAWRVAPVDNDADAAVKDSG